VSSVHVAAVVVSYKRPDLLRRTVEALQRTTYVDLRILVVDNGSDALAAGVLADIASARVEILRLERNYGFAGGVNRGIEHLLRFARKRPDVIALVNPDCIVDPGWLGPFVSVLGAEPETGVVGARLYEPDGVTLQHAGGAIASNGLTLHYGRGSRVLTAYSGSRDVDYVTGALCAFRLDAWEDVGPFDERYFPAYFEEADFCVRAREAGYRIRYVPESEAIHHEASSSEKGSTRFLKMYHRNRLRFAARHLVGKHRFGKFVRAEWRWLKSQRRFSDVLPAARAYTELLAGRSRTKRGVRTPP
jgi:GT2 family glycosyltransferase